MSIAQPDLRLVEDDEATADTSEPKVFVRSITAPPGLPWDQARAAGLEARLGAPIPLGGVTYQLRRLDTWAPGASARFAAFYVRSEEVHGQLTTFAEVDGRSVQVVFSSAAELRRRARRLAIMAGAAALVLVLLAAPALWALKARADAETRLTGMEQTVAAKMRQANNLRSLKRQARILDAAHARGRGLSDVVADLAMVSTAKAPGARIQAFHWDKRYIAVEARGDGEPFARLGRLVRKSDRPSRSGVWLWVIAPADGEPLARGRSTP